MFIRVCVNVFITTFPCVYTIIPLYVCWCVHVHRYTGLLIVMCLRMLICASASAVVSHMSSVLDFQIPSVMSFIHSYSLLLLFASLSFTFCISGYRSPLLPSALEPFATSHVLLCTVFLSSQFGLFHVGCLSVVWKFFSQFLESFVVS